jgi:pimeloyl-ACP methyl ester carboxylesterase
MTKASILRRYADGLFLSPSAEAAHGPEDFGLRTIRGTLCGASGKTSAEVMVFENPALPHAGSIVYCWGGAGNMHSRFPAMLPFADAGFKVLTFDPVGFGTLSGTPTLRSFTDNSAEAAESLITCLPEGEKIVLFADFISAVPALIAAREKHSRLSLLVLQNSFAGFGTYLSERFGPVLGRAVKSFISKGLEDPVQSLETLTDVPLLCVTAGGKRAFPRETQRLKALRNPQIRHLDLTGEGCGTALTLRDEILRIMNSETAGSAL